MKSDHDRPPNKWRHGGTANSIAIATRRSRSTTSFITKHYSGVMLSGFCFLLSSYYLAWVNELHSYVHVTIQLSSINLSVSFNPQVENKKSIFHSSSPLIFSFLNHCHYQCFLMISDVCVYVSFSPSFYVHSIFCAVFSFLYDWSPHGLHLNHFH